MNPPLPASSPSALAASLAGWEHIWLFLDYDGTLADFAPTPDDILLDGQLICLVNHLTDNPRLRVAILSGRRLAHIQALLPVPDLLLAGSYGLELQLPSGEQENLLAYLQVRPILDRVKPAWQALIHERPGFYLEDKGWALAIHARFVEDETANRILKQARTVIEKCEHEPGIFHLSGGHKFLEIAPRQANKGKSLATLLVRFPWPGALPIFIGDDDKDEEAFVVVQDRGGVGIQVGAARPTAASFRLASPVEVRGFLEILGSDNQ